MSILRAVDFFASVKYAPADDGLVFLKPLGAYYYYVPVMSVKCHIQCSNVVVGVCSFFFAHVLQRCEKCRNISEWGRGLWKILSRCLWRLSFHQTWNLHDQILGRRRISQRNCNFSLSEILGDPKWWISEIISESQSHFRGRNFELISRKIGTSGHPRYSKHNNT